MPSAISNQARTIHEDLRQTPLSASEAGLTALSGTLRPSGVLAETRPQLRVECSQGLRKYPFETTDAKLHEPFAGMGAT